MAWEATHIRFALDLKDEYKIQDIEKYISGAIYPDTRFITGVNRNLTHDINILSTEFAIDDFKKGWQAHLICDAFLEKMRMKYFSELTLSGNINQGDDFWVAISAIKIIQDMNDFKSFDLQNYLKYLYYVNNPLGEDINDIKKFNNLVIALYDNKKEVKVDDYCRFLQSVGISKEQREKIKEKTKEFLDDIELLNRINSIYNKIIFSYKKVLWGDENKKLI